MLGYLFIGLALLSGIIKGYCGKKSGNKIEHASDAMLMNTIRMILCIFIGSIIVLVSGNYQTIKFDMDLILPSLICGVCTGLFAVSWILSVRRGAYMLVEVFILCGTIIPIVMCNLFYGESIELLHWIGIGLLILAAYIMCTYNKTLNQKISVRDILLLLLCALSNGFADFSQKMFVKNVENGNIAFFNLMTYIFSSIFLLIVCIVFRNKEKEKYELKKPIEVIKPIILYVCVMAICLFLNSYFKTIAATYLNAAQIYPINYGGSLILSLLMARIIFKEKVNLKCIIGVLLAFIALLLINVF